MTESQASASLFHVHASGRLETLAERLADTMRAQPGDPLSPERIVVPHPLLGQWLRLQLAERLGIAAHLRIELPAEFAWSTMHEALPALSAEAIFEPAYLRWRIFEQLAAWPGDDEIRRYLADNDARKRFELADRLAIAYDRCLVYRPQEIRRWQRGEASGWHARLWNELVVDQAPALHWVDAIGAYQQESGSSRTRPARVSFFGVDTLSPSYRDILAAAAQALDVYLFLLSPRRDFWRTSPQRQTSGYYAEANELLEAWARPARDMQALVMDASRVRVAGDDGPELAPASQSCLGIVQRDLLGDETPTPVPSAADDSIQIHVCHSATREVEVLHDRLLGLFDDHPDIQPADVMVLTPDLDTYAPIIKAVFSGTGRIRFQVGRERFREGAAVTAFLDLLDLPGSRYTANGMIAPLRAESVRACFGIDEGDIEGIRDWLRRAGIRWGRNAEHRTPLGVPPSPNHTWRHGLRRLLLGYAIDGEDTLHDDITPCALNRWGNAGASDYELLGRFHRYCEFAFALDDWHTDERTPAEWAERLRGEILAPFFTAERRFHPEVGREVGAVARLIHAFVSECEQARTIAPLSFAVLRDVLAEHAATSIRGVPRLADGVTVAGLASGQVLPAKVVCAVGMNDGVFPSRPPPMPFEFVQDLFGSADHAVGDRDVRDDDRFAFLATVLAARRCLILTYTGRDLQEDKPIPASVVVSELTAYLERRFPDIGGWETRHPLQPFSPRYFRNDEPNLFSYAKPMADAASALGRSDAAPQRFRGAFETGDARPIRAEVDIEELVRFSASPTTHFLRHVLRINLGVRDDEIDDDEPFQLDALQAWQLKSDLAGFGNAADERTNRLATASGLLPPGNLARIQHRESSDEIADLVDALAPFIDHTASADVDIEVNDTRIVGRVEGLHGDKAELVWHRIGRVRTKDEIALWLRLLALVCAKGQPFAAYLFGSKTASAPVVLSGPSPTTAREYLGDWVAAWHDGQCKALPFFPDTSWAAAEGNGLATPWSGMPWSEGNTDYHLLAYPDGPSADGFETLATKLLGPLQDARS